MNYGSGTEVFFWVVGALIVLGFSYWLIKSVFRLLVGAADLGGEAAAIVYETGTSDIHFLLKVIITIMFPPLLILWIWKALRDGAEETISEGQEATDQEAVNKEAMKQHAQRLEEQQRKNAELWSGKLK